MPRKRTHEEFVNKIFELVHDEYSVLSKYENARKKIIMRHNRCGHIWSIVPHAFLGGTRCPKCMDKISRIKHRKSPEKYRKEFYSVANGEYELLSEYTTSENKVKIRHNKCGKVYEIYPMSFLNGRRCRECSIKEFSQTRIKSNGEFLKEIHDLVGDEYTVLDEYITSDIKIKMKHNKCGHIYYVSPSKFLTGRRCPKCKRPNYYKDTAQFKKEVFDLEGDEYNVIGEYKNAKTKILIKHMKCGYEYSVTPDDFITGSRCPKCNESSGENSVRKFLEKHKIKYESQYRIKECKNINTLPFDFALFNRCNLIALIEYQGEQHYKSIDFFGGEEGFKYRQNNDNIKRNYCKLNNIPLIEIPYTIENIEEYLEKQLLKINTLIIKTLM